MWILLLALFLCGCRRSTGECDNGDIRLVGGRSYLEGRVEVCFERNWGTVCDDLWNERDANVACRQLGYSDRGAVPLGNPSDIDPHFRATAMFGQGSGRIVRGELLCTGNESSLLDCLTDSMCLHDEDAGLICQDNDVVLVQEEQVISNNSVVSLDSLGDFNVSSPTPLLCVTTQPFCCDTNRSGTWFPPESSDPLDTSPNSPRLYQSWEDDQSIRLNRPSGISSTESGLYRCEVPDKDNVIQILYVGIYSSADEGAVTISDISYDKSSQTVICTSSGGPATSVTWTRDTTPLNIDGTTYQHSQIITDTVTATYENRLSILTKEDDLSGSYTCSITNSRSDDTSSATMVTVCRDGLLMRLDDSSMIAICVDNQWIKLESSLKIQTEESIIHDLVGRSDISNMISLSWQVLNAGSINIMRYDTTCSNDQGTVSNQADGNSETVNLTTVISPPAQYNCCIIAYLERTLFNLVDYTSTSCVEINVSEIITESVASQVVKGLGVMCGLLVVLVIVLLVGYLVLLMKRSKNYYPSTQQVRGRVRTDHLLDNPIYRIPGPRVSEGQRNETGSSSHHHRHNSSTVADNPQYGTVTFQPLDQPPTSPPGITNDGVTPDPIYSDINLPLSTTV